MKKQKSKERTISGLVIPATWDDDDNVVGVAIETEEYEEYLVEPNEKGKELMALIDYKVEATGTVKQRADGDMVISVKRYESLGQYDQYDEDEYDQEGYGKGEEEEW